MEWEEWDALARRLERSARGRPRAYRLRVGLLALLGYAYLLVALLLTLAAAAAIVVAALHGAAILGKLAIPFLALAVVIVRSLWVRIPPPDHGVRVDPGRAPKLFETVDEVRRRVGGPRVHELRVTDDFNAAIIQVPRLGLIGWPRNYLLVGLPLMQGLSRDEIEAVLAHEFGHLSGKHSRFSGWIYRVRRTWSQLLERLEQKRQRGSALFRRFFEWYAPYFSAYSFALARHQEYEADQASARTVGARSAAASLVAVNVGAAYVDQRYWPSVFRRAEEEPEPPRAFVGLISKLPVTRDEPVESLLAEALARETGTADTHPSLADRLEALGVAPADAAGLLPKRGPEGGSAAAELLGDLERQLAEEFDSRWRKAVADQWRANHGELAAARKRFVELDGCRDALVGEELLEYADLTARFGEEGDAIPLYRRLLDEQPDHPRAGYGLGLLLLARDDDEGLAHLHRAMDADPEAILPACEAAYGYLMKHGREEEAKAYLARAEDGRRVLEEARLERATLDEHDPLEPHGLSDESMERLQQELDSQPDVRCAYVARKRLLHFAETAPLYVVGVDPVAHGAKPAELIKELSRTLTVPGEFFVVNLAGKKYRALASRFRQIEGTRIKRD